LLVKMFLLPIALNLLKTLELTLSLNQNRSERGMQNKFKKNPPIFIEGFVYERQALAGFFMSGH
ncbi:MAG: hypothetical protein MK214_13940, partial [Thalassotalea sp.]|nr:hypothetical protein [Thalassotalea sp.]